MSITERFGALTLRTAAIFLFSSLLFLSANASTLTVTKTADTNDDACDADCSLREAIAAANAAATDDVIEFDGIVFGTAQTITLSGTQLVINNNGLSRPAITPATAKRTSPFFGRRPANGLFSEARIIPFTRSRSVSRAICRRRPTMTVTAKRTPPFSVLRSARGTS